MFYITLSEPSVLSFQAAVGQIKANDGYLSQSECPYSPTIKAFLEQLANTAPAVEAGPTDFDLAEDKLTFIEKQIGKALQDLNGLTSSDPSDRLQIIKAKTGLIEKLVGARERIWSLREMSEFQSIIIGFLEDICNKDQVTDMKTRLRGLKTVEQSNG